MFAQKYCPKNLREFIGHREPVSEFLKLIKNWKSGEGILLHGPPGVGKTALVVAYANGNNLDLIETNASDFRSSSQLKEWITSSVSQQSLFKRGKIFLFDEIDGVSGYEDKGGVSEMIKIIKESRYPIILIANNPYDKKLQSLRVICKLLQFRKLPVWDIVKKLNQVVAAEKIPIGPELLHIIAKKSQGDLRSAINDLEIISLDKEISYENVSEIGEREREANVFDALKSIFKTNSVLAAKLSIGGIDKDPDEIFWWIENNITAEYEDPEEVAKAYDALSKSDLFKQRIRSRQNWKFMSYMIDLMTGGVATSKKESYRKFTRYQYPSNIMILGKTKAARASASAVVKKVSHDLHCSSRKFKTEFLPYFQTMFKDVRMRNKILSSLNLDREEFSKIFV